jgi:hypothetical protein
MRQVLHVTKRDRQAAETALGFVIQGPLSLVRPHAAGTYEAAREDICELPAASHSAAGCRVVADLPVCT